MSKTLAPFAAAAALVALVAAGPAGASPAASPYDGGPLGGAFATVQILQTGLFGLGFDPTTVGVADSDLATVGPQLNTTNTSGASHMLIVDDLQHVDCPNAQYHTIQSAVDAAPPGAMIKVCPGTYVEQVHISTGKVGLTLFSEGYLQAVIKAPPLMTSPKAIVRVDGGQNITIRHFTITGPGSGGCDTLEYGVRVDSGGSATITDNHITHIRDTPFSGCQNGIGVLVGRNAENSFGVATVVHNLIDDYQKGGIVIDGQFDPNAGGGGLLVPASEGSGGVQPSHAEVAYNEVDGIGPTPVIAQNGIQVSRNAFADVHHNVVTGNEYSLPPFFGEGVLLYQTASSQTSVDHNKVFDNADGIGLYTTSNADVGWNHSYSNNRYDGVFADSDTAANTIEHNLLTDNVEFDCDDLSAGVGTAGTANFWIQDLGYTENRPGLCKHATP